MNIFLFTCDAVGVGFLRQEEREFLVIGRFEKTRFTKKHEIKTRFKTCSTTRCKLLLLNRKKKKRFFQKRIFIKTRF